MGRKAGWVIYCFILLGCALSSIWLTDLNTEQLVFNLHVSMKGVNNNATWNCLLFACTGSACILAGGLALIRWLRLRHPTHILLKWLDVTLQHRKSTAVVLLLACLFCVNYHLEVVEYLQHQREITAVYQDEYVNPRDVVCTFPQKPRNLVYIFLESMEVTYSDQHEGGAQEANLIPELYSMAQSNVNFSPTDGFGGAEVVPGATWTMAAMVAQTSGIPLKLPFDGEKYYGNYSKILPGLWTLGDILQEHDYQQVVMMGSDSSFAGRGDYFRQHGDYQIDDYATAVSGRRIPVDYHEWWGYEDRKLFVFAKERLRELAAEDQPFNLTILTVDTHFEDGYVCPLCPDDEEEQYANVIRCSSYQVAEFVRWIQQQDFYEDTTIVISGDHLSMDSNFFRSLDESYNRQVYNCILNADVDNPHLYEKKRLFTTLDMFPTTLAAMGVRIEGNRLGLGTNLFSGQQTLAERMGMEELTEQLSRNSHFYNYNFLYEH